jgi:ABC-2 type transport system ATP-binding protein
MVDANLTRQRHRVIGNLSKGFRQRVVLAQALLGEPAVLVLDEPTSGIDAETLEDFYRVAGAYGRHHAVLLSTHVTDDVRALCHRTLVMVDGHVNAGAPPSDPPLTGAEAGRLVQAREVGW